MTGPSESEPASPVFSGVLFLGAFPLSGYLGSADGELGLRNLLVLVALSRLLRMTFGQVE